jgi:hypothetical protein
MVLGVASEQVAALCSNSAHHGVLRKLDCAFSRLLPDVWSSQTLPHQRGAKLEEQLAMDLMVVFGSNARERWQSLSAGRRQDRYPSGASNSDGAANDWMSFPGNRSMASDTAWAR